MLNFLSLLRLLACFFPPSQRLNGPYQISLVWTGDSDVELRGKKNRKEKNKTDEEEEEKEKVGNFDRESSATLSFI